MSSSPRLSALVLLSIPLACGPLGPGPGEDGSPSPSGLTGLTARCDGALPGDDSACVAMGSEAFDIPHGLAIVGSGTSDGHLRLFFTQDGLSQPPSLIIEYDRDATPGTLRCAEDPTTVIFVGADGLTRAAFEDMTLVGADCQLTLTATGPSDGDAIEGEFTGLLWEDSHGPLREMAGRFKTSVTDDEAQ